MKKVLARVAAAFAVVLSSGCANWPGLADDRVEVIDYRKMQFIEEQAKRNGVTVIWMRPSTKLVDRGAAN